MDACDGGERGRRLRHEHLLPLPLLVLLPSAAPSATPSAGYYMVGVGEARGRRKEREKE
jgi:hypothetical protein